MIKIKTFTFNPFQENTYVVSDETGQCIIFDPGCYDSHEETILSEYINHEKLKPVMLTNTHAHIDHVFGNHFIFSKYGLKPHLHQLELSILENMENVGRMYGVNATASPSPEGFLDENQPVKFGNSTLELIFAPGHSPGSLCFYNKESKNLIAGDVLFQLSIGRTDLPGGNHADLIASITEKLMKLPDDVVVHPGHGPTTTIGFERKNNPFIN